MMSFRKNNTEADIKPRKIEFSKEDMEEMDAGLFGEFRKVIMGSLNPSFFACLFSTAGRPSCPVDLVIGIMILACFLGVSEDTVLSQLKGNIYYQYALCMDAYSYVIPSKRTLIRMRMRIIMRNINCEEDVLHKQCVAILHKLALHLHLKGDYSRMDSVMLNIYAKSLSRSQLVYYVIQGVVFSLVNVSKKKLYENEKGNNLKIEDIDNPQKIIESRTMRHELADKAASGARLPQRLWHYLYMDDYNSRFYRVGNSANVSKEILEDAVLLWRNYHKTLEDRNEFQLFARVLREQCEWVDFIGSPDDGASGITHAVKRVLRFKLSKKETEQIQKSRRDLEKLEDKELRLRRKQEKVNETFRTAKKKAMEATERAEKARANGAANYEKLAEKAKVASEKADILSQTAEKSVAEYNAALETLGSELRLREAADTYVVVDDSMEGELGQMDSCILQSPLDSSATFCEKAGKYFRGYKICILEVSDGKGHSMPVEWITTQNNVSDATAGACLIQRLGKLYPETKAKLVAADGAFSGKEMDAAAKNAGVEIVNTEMTGLKAPDHLAEFEFDETGTQIIKCAGGQKPQKHGSPSKNGIASAVVDASKCAKCKYFSVCKPAINGKKATVKASAKQKARAVFQRLKGSDAHSAIGRFRNGVEALMNLFKRKSPVTRQSIYSLFRVALYNDIAMIATGFSKYLSQKNIPHDEPRIDGDYFGLFPEDEAAVKSARIEIEREFRKAPEEREPVVREEFMSPMVIPEPAGAGMIVTDSEQMTVENVDEKTGTSAEAENLSSVSSKETQPDSDEGESSISLKDSDEADVPANEHHNTEGNYSGQECPDVKDSETRGAKTTAWRGAAIQDSDGPGEASTTDIKDTSTHIILERFLDFTPRKKSRCSRHIKNGEDQDKTIGA